MKLSLIYLLSILSFTEIVVAQQVYYPLTIGNRWEYQHIGPWGTTIVIGDTVMPNSKTYFVLQSKDIYFEYLSQEGNTVYGYDSYSGTEELLYDFSKSSGDTILTIPGETDTSDYILCGKDTVSIFGQNRLRFGFCYDYMRHAIDDEQVIEFVDSIGPTAITTAFAYQTLWRAWIDGKYYETVDVKVQQKEVSFSLNQNYPNPFNPSTAINYSIPIAGTVSLKIYDLLGREIELLVNEFKTAGEHTAAFNGSHLPSGIYFYELKAGNYRAVKKMQLLK
jgi:hypothetical protein